MRVLNGMSEVAGQGIYTVQGLRANGVDANMVVWSRNRSGYAVDIDLGIDKGDKVRYPIYAVKMGLFALKALLRYDTYHFHFGYSLLPYHLDLPFDKLLKKRIFSEFHGSDIRFLFHDIEYQYAKTHWVDPRVKEKARKQVRNLIDYSDGVILHDVELVPHLPDGMTTPLYMVPLRVDISRFTPTLSAPKDRPVIVHAPSKRSGKGTEGILQALKKVKGDFDFILVEGKTQQEAFQLYEKADIVIDQISGGSYGVFAIEAMAMGKPVITYITDEVRKTFPETLPIVSAQFDDLPDVLDDLLADADKRRALGAAGRAYVERYHDNVKVTRYLRQIYDGTISNRNLFELL